LRFRFFDAMHPGGGRQGEFAPGQELGNQIMAA
jgi:hypothetical protein